MKNENLVLILTPLILILSLSFIQVTKPQSDQNDESSDANASVVESTKTESVASSTQSENTPLTDSSDFKTIVDEMAKMQQEETEKYQQEVTETWGEYKDSDEKEWVSYTNDENIRRTVNYETGDVSVELILSETSMIEKNVKSLIEKETESLLNTTEAEAFKNDKIAQRVEARLPKNNKNIQWGSPKEVSLFNTDEKPSLEFNYDGFIKTSSALKTTARARLKKSKIKGKVIAETKLKVDKRFLYKTEQYNKVVRSLAKTQKISPALIYAVIQTESNFNPLAKSPVPAYGLMQIVPGTAGKDATKHLWGDERVLPPSYLYSSINNILIGASYLHVLYYKYLRKIKDPQSRMYCAIAAYNTGATNVARAFIKSRNFNRAVGTINKLTSDQVYRKLVKRLPYRETRHYVKRVTKGMNSFWVMQQKNLI